MTTKLVERVSFRDTDHTYYLEGKRIPSVTGILGNLSKPALVWWSAKEGAKAVKSRVLELQDEIDSGLVDVIGFADELYELARTAHNDRKNRAAAKGSAVHAAIEKYHSDFYNATPPTDPDELSAWNAFTTWWATSNLTMLDLERKIVDPDGRYAGRLDLVAQDTTGAVFVCDLKTSNRTYTEHHLQNAAYAHALESEGNHHVQGTKVLWLPSGCTKLTVVERDYHEWRIDYEIFAKLVDVHRYRVGMDAWMKEIVAEHGPAREETTT